MTPLQEPSKLPAQGTRILVIDDEPSIRRFLRASLTSHGFDVFEAATARDGLTRAAADRPDAVILDLGLPDLDGLEVLVGIRRRSAVPIIILSVRDDESDKIAALDLGADDYLSKPFGEGELLARLRAVLRRLSPGDPSVFTTGVLTVDIAGHRVSVDGQPLSVTPTEFALLKLLAGNAGKVVTHSVIYREIWEKTEDFEGVAHLLRVTVSNLRNKIEPQPERPTYIVTEPGIGYRLNAK